MVSAGSHTSKQKKKKEKKEKRNSRWEKRSEIGITIGRKWRRRTKGRKNKEDEGRGRKEGMNEGVINTDGKTESSK